jgi:hypothetical protein
MPALSVSKGYVGLQLRKVFAQSVRCHRRSANVIDPEDRCHPCAPERPETMDMSRDLGNVSKATKRKIHIGRRFRAMFGEFGSTGSRLRSS